MVSSEIRYKDGYYKNVDDILTTAKDIGELEARMKTLLKICRAHNMKLAALKFKMGQRVVYRGTMLEASKQINDRDLQKRCAHNVCTVLLYSRQLSY